MIGPRTPNGATSHTFRADVKKWKEATDERIEAFARQVCFEMARSVVKATPVDTGFLRGSWQPSIGEPKDAEGSEDPGGAKASAIASLVSADVKLGDKFYMVNNAKYARRIEYGFVGEDSLGRKFNQSGRYFVGDTVARFKVICRKVARDLKLTEATKRKPNGGAE
jgi:Bacteriophage HK97-gp10, putative tail-component